MKCYGPVVQQVERLTGSQEVVGSKPTCVHHQRRSTRAWFGSSNRNMMSAGI